MRALIWHVDSFVCRITEKGRSPVVEPMGERETRVGEALLVLASVEKSDERAPQTIAPRAATMLAEHARRLKVGTIVLHSFAHLFAELAKPEIAIDVLKETETHLNAQGFAVIRSPFGWFNELEIKAKGHPLSRLARTISAED
ncbi:MAG: threonyl-tRNA synthetase editing domain-containing protein [Chloroflexota bacterium]